MDDGSGVHLDFQKTFDKVPHRRLLAEAGACGVVGLVANSIGNWFGDRKQRGSVSGRMHQRKWSLNALTCADVDSQQLSNGVSLRRHLSIELTCFLCNP